MTKLKFLIRAGLVGTMMFLNLVFLQFLFADRCSDRGGRFLYDILMCEGHQTFISFSLPIPIYAATCIFFGLVTIPSLWLTERILMKDGLSKTKCRKGLTANRKPNEL